MADTAVAGVSQSVSQTGPAQGAPKADRSKWLKGDLEGLNGELADRLAQMGQRLGTPIDVRSGHRSREEQEGLYAKYLAGTGNLAAKPGSSNHESGNAADIYVNGQAARDNPEAKQIAADLGLKFTVPSESWHIELAA